MDGRGVTHQHAGPSLPRFALFCALVGFIGAGAFTYAQYTHAQFVKRQVATARDLLRADRPQDAELALKLVLSDDPDNPAALEALAKVYLATQNFAEAVTTLRSLVRTAPETPGAYANLAECLRLQQDARGALDTAEEGVRRSPNDVAALAEAARLLKGADEGARELEYERRMVKIRPEDTPALKMLGAALVRYGFYRESLPVLEKLSNLTPNDPTIWTLRGQALYRADTSAKGLKQSESYLLKALALTPESYAPNLILGRVYVRMKQPDKAIPYLIRAGERVPTRKDADFVLAQAYDQTGQRSLAETTRKRFVAWRRETEAVKQLTKRVALNPESFDDNLELGNLKLKRGELRDAQQYLARAAQIRPENGSAQRALQRLQALVESGAQDQSTSQDGE